jgi:translation elongation factor EF-1beta
MSSVAVLFKVYPKENMTEKALENIKREMNPAGMQVEDIGFGIKVIKVMFKFDNTKTTSSEIEDNLRKVEGVGELEVEEEGLL